MWKFEKFVYEERLNSWDEEFAILVYKDVDGFLNEKSNRCCVLIFPPLNNRRRYLIHKLGELFNVHTFSVGEGLRRLTVVCPFEKIEKKVDEEKKVMDKIDSKKGAISKAKRARPDAPIYIPPPIRKLQKTPQPEKNESTHKSSKNDNRQKNIKKPISSVTTCEIPQKSEAEDFNIKVDTSDLCTRQLDAEQIKCESTVSVQKVDENKVPDKNVIKITSASEISTALQSVETHLDTYGPIVPNSSENITENLQINSHIVENSVESNNETVSKDNQNVVEINIKCASPNSNTKSNEENVALNNGNEKTEIFDNENNSSPNSNTKSDEENEELNNENDIKEIGENENNLSPNSNTKSNEENEELNNVNDIKEIGENENNSSPNSNTKSNEENEPLNNGNDNKDIWGNQNNLSKDNDQEQEELLRASEEINRKNKRIIKQSFNNSDILIISNDNNENANTVQPTEKDAPVDCWEDLLEGGGELDSELMQEIMDKVGKVHISKAKEDYSEFKQKTSLEGDHAHVLEIYDFPKEFTTRDLVSILDSHKAGIYHIKWVDDNHALGVFSSGFVATEMLKIEHPLIKLRPMTEASKQSISKAIRYPNAMLPTAVRPPTCAQAARRMVSGALGLKLINAKEERAKEIKILKEAREKKKLSAKQQDDAWEGKPSSN